MPFDPTRRDALRSLAVLGAAPLVALLPASAARAAAIQVPTVDRLAITVLVDSSFDIFLRPTKVNGVTVDNGRRLPDFRRSLHNEWGLALWLESQAGDARRN